MTHVDFGQCGLCIHFGEHSNIINMDALVKIRRSHEADETLVAECGHPNNEQVNLRVTPVSGCDGFEPASDAR